jgi:hypothetical protein
MFSNLRWLSSYELYIFIALCCDNTFISVCYFITYGDGVPLWVKDIELELLRDVQSDVLVCR